MKRDDILGIALGIVMGAYAVAGNVLRGDTHLVSVFPFWLGFAILPAFLGIALASLGRHGLDRPALQRSGTRITTIGAVVFAILLAAFGTIWFSEPSIWLVLFGFAGALVLALALGGLTTWLCSRIVAKAA